MSFLQISLSIPTIPLNLSSSTVLFSPNPLFLTSKLSHLSLRTTKTTPIRMGGGPRTFPGGVSKWQWKRMQAKKAKQLLKARLARERQIYEMRKRAELKAAVSELERPWEVVERAPKLFSVRADEQVKVLADRFQRAGGFDMWSEKDGPQLFSEIDGVPSARFFPKGVVHSVKPYGKIEGDLNEIEGLGLLGSGLEPENGTEINGYRGRFSDGEVGVKHIVESTVDRNGKSSNGKSRKKRGRRFGVENLSNLNVSGKIDKGFDGIDELSLLGSVPDHENGTKRNGYRNSGRFRDGLSRSDGQVGVKNTMESSVDRNGKGSNGKFRNKGQGERKRFGVENSNNLNRLVSGGVGVEGEQRRENPVGQKGDNGHRRGSGSGKLRGQNSEVYDMSLQHDGSYGFRAED